MFLTRQNIHRIDDDDDDLFGVECKRVEVCVSLSCGVQLSLQSLELVT